MATSTFVLGFLLLLLPLAVYLASLAYVNGRPHPTLVPGPWDFAGVLLALSGFLLVGGPAALAGLNDQWRFAVVHGRLRLLNGLGLGWWLMWTAIWGVYFAGVCGGAAWLLWRRRAYTVIYNSEPAVLFRCLDRVCESLGLTWVRQGQHLVLQSGSESSLQALEVGPSESAPEEGPITVTPLQAVAVLKPTVRAVVEIDSFPLMRHLTLRWTEPGSGVQRDVEAALAEALREVIVGPNPTAHWLLVLSGSFLLVVIGALAALIWSDPSRP
ncbi:MAG: hypothetical protein NZ700_13275 [Gemmataceae bacterium]|nr:hypothetical protein [Gemmataceae bacterium]MDW8266919.1 hypothetical protein [Gemmataceae bacterium]